MALDEEPRPHPTEAPSEPDQPGAFVPGIANAPPAQPHPTVWIRALRDHTYHGKPVPEGSVYLAHEDIVDTIEILKFGRREPPPPTAQRPVVVQTQEAQIVSVPDGRLPPPLERRLRRDVVTTTDLSPKDAA